MLRTDYTGVTTVADGLLRLQHATALPSGNLQLTGGGVLGLGAGDLTARTIGTGASQVQWLDSGGFAAFGATRAVKFDSASINWTAANFIGQGRVLILGHDAADATLDWQQPISLAGYLRSVQVDDGSAAIDAKMSGVIAGGSSGTNNIFNKTGAGTLAFTAQNTYWGETIINSGTLMIGDGGAVGGVSQNTPIITVEPGAVLAVNRNNTLTQGTAAFKVAVTGDGGFTQAGTGNIVLMLANAYIGPTTLDAGTLTLGAAGVLPDASGVFIGNATLAAGPFAETMGRLTLTGSATIQLVSGAALAFGDSSTVAWTGGTLALTGNFVSGASLRFGTDRSGLTPSQLALISIDGNAAPLALDNLGYLISGYSAWRTANAPVTGANPNADEDGDGVANGVEFVLGGLISTKDTSKLPQVSTNGGNILFTFKRDQKSIGATTVLRIETSPDLLDWTTSYAVPDNAANNNPGVSVIKGTPEGFDTITLTLPLSDSKKFSRLKVTP
jgi:fibronectin-binding autotransporter adhesin